MKLKNHLNRIVRIVLVVAVCSTNSLGQYDDLAFHKYDFPNAKEQLETAKENLTTGDFHYVKKEYYHALTPYLKAYTFNPNNSLLNAKIADCYFHTSDYVKAEKHMLRAIDLNSDLDGYYWYLKAYLYQYNGEFEKALKAYFEAEDKSSKLMRNIDKEIRDRILECKKGEKFMNHPMDVEIQNMGDMINTENNEYIPVIDHECSRMIFTSRRPNNLHDQIDESLGDYFEDLYVSYKTPDGWTRAENFNFPINSENHDATIALSADGANMLVYRDDAEGIGNVYLAKKIDGLWFDPVKLPAPINSEYHETSAYFSPDMKYLYFVSDRPGGYGGKDIYRSEIWPNQEFGPVENLGPNINTALDDDGVFLFGEEVGEMYFSSEGHGGMGGHDIYKSVWQDSIWGPAENLGYPVNSAANDVSFVLSSDSVYGYLASSREDSRGRYDIYQITFNKRVYIPPPPPTFVNLKGLIADEVDGTPLKAIVTALDSETGEVITFDESDECTGDYRVKLDKGKRYTISVLVPGYVTHEEEVFIADNDETNQSMSINVKRLELGTTIVLDKVYYELNMASLSDSSFEALDKVVELMVEYPEIRLQISAHTDSRGTDEYNRRLSKARAQTCVDYLMSRGIPEESLMPVGYGTSQLLISDEEIEALPEEEREDAHQMNRRTEFKVIK